MFEGGGKEFFNALPKIARVSSTENCANMGDFDKPISGIWETLIEWVHSGINLGGGGEGVSGLST